MTTKPWPESNPHPERGPLWVQFDRYESDPRHALLTGDAICVVLVDRSTAEAHARQLGQECPPPPTKKVLWKHAIGERLPDGREIVGARGSAIAPVVFLPGNPLGQGWPVGADGMVEVLA